MVNGMLYINTANSSYNLSGGNLTVILSIDNSGNFTQTGGATYALNTSAYSIINEPGGTIALSGGTFGSYGLLNGGNFFQSNGTLNDVIGNFYNYAGSNYTLSGANSTLFMDNSAGTPSAINNGTFTQSNGLAFLYNLSGNGTFSLTGGVLALSGSSNSLDNLTFAFNGGAILTTSNISTSAAMTIASGGGTFSPSASTTFALSASLSGNGTLTLNGNGTLSLSGNSTYSGGTTISNGTLAVTNTSGNATGTGNVTLNGGTLIGNGSISGIVIAGSGAHTINPGTVGGVGNLTIGGLSTNSNTTLAFDLDSPTGTSDLLHVTGNITLSNGTLAITSQNSRGAASLGYYPVITYTGTLTGTRDGVVLPTISNNVSYTLETTRMSGIIYVHRGFVGDATDDGNVDLNDLNIVLNNLGLTTPLWSSGNFDGAASVDLNDLNDVLNNLGTHILSTSAIVAGNYNGVNVTQRIEQLERLVWSLQDPLTPGEITEIQNDAESLGLFARITANDPLPAPRCPLISSQSPILHIPPTYNPFRSLRRWHFLGLAAVCFSRRRR